MLFFIGYRVKSKTQIKFMRIVLLLFISTAFLAGCNFLEKKYSGDARSLMPDSRQIISEAKLLSEEAGLFKDFGIEPIDSLKREYNKPNGSFYILILTYENKDNASFQFVMFTTFLTNEDTPPVPIEDEERGKMMDTGSSTLLYNITPSTDGKGFFVEVWQLFQKDNVVVIVESFGATTSDDSEPLLTERIKEAQYYANIVAEKIR